METLKFKQLTKLTGYRYSIFGKTLDYVGRNNEYVGKNKELPVDIDFDDEVECNKWINEIKEEVMFGEKSILATEELYSNSIKHCIASFSLLFLCLFTTQWYFSLIFLISAAFFLARKINLMESCRMQNSFLSIGKWVIQENEQKILNPNKKIDFNALSLF